MHSKHLRALAVTAAAGALALTVSNAASAGAASDTVLRSGDGDTLRAVFYDGQNATGDRLFYYGGSACTASTTSAEFSYADLRRVGWNDRIESIRDYNSCDVNVFRDINFLGGSTGYVNYGSVGKNLTSTFRNQVSSFKVS